MGTRIGSWQEKLKFLCKKQLADLGYEFIKLGRKMIRAGMGRCSWCGGKPGFSSSVSSKGLRCRTLIRDCEKEP